MFEKASVVLINAIDAIDKKSSKLKIVFNGQETIFDFSAEPVFFSKEFLNDGSIENGKFLGKGGQKRVFYVNGQAIFIIASRREDLLEITFKDEIGISEALSKQGLQTQRLKKSSIKFYDKKEKCYYDYPCMVADSFSLLSSRGIEVMDSKNQLRFGRKFRLYTEEKNTNDIEWNFKAFEGALDDLAKLLFLNYNFPFLSSDTINVSFLKPKNEKEPAQVRLFLYDFSAKGSKESTLKSNILKETPSEYTVNDKIETILKVALEGECMAKENKRFDFPPDFVSYFIKKIYPSLKNSFVKHVLQEIEVLIKTQSQLELKNNGVTLSFDALRLKNSNTKEPESEKHEFEFTSKNITNNL